MLVNDISSNDHKFKGIKSKINNYYKSFDNEISSYFHYKLLIQ